MRGVFCGMKLTGAWRPVYGLLSDYCHIHDCIRRSPCASASAQARTLCYVGMSAMENVYQHPQVDRITAMSRVQMNKFLYAFLVVNITLFAIGSLRMVYISISGERDDTVTSQGQSNPCPNKTCECDGVARANIPATGHQASHNDSEFLVPNIVHYIWFNTETQPLQFHHLLSILSAHKVLSPDVIYFHTNKEPNGKYWEMAKSIPSLNVNFREPPTSLFGEKIKAPKFYTSHSNVDRVKVLMEYGGIYLDFDTLVLRPFDKLRKYPCTIAQEIETKACGCVIVCSKNSFFLTLWINAYIDDYRMDEWAYNSGQVPYNLARRYPNLVHVDKGGLLYPNFRELDKLWGNKTWDWRNNYSVHLYYRLWKGTSPYYKGVEPNEENVKTWKGTFGEIARMILYGSTAIMDRELYLEEFQHQT